MKKEIILAGVAGFVLGIFIAPTFTPIMSMMWGNRMIGQIDSHFIEEMIPHHEDAIAMANLALTRAEHANIKTLATSIIKDQSKEIEQMKQWYTSWFGKDVSGVSESMGHSTKMTMHGGMMGDTSDLKSLEASNPFDRAFIEEMIPHHQMAVMMAQMLLSSTNRPEMKQLAENIISSQTKEINQMRGWYRSWYGN